MTDKKNVEEANETIAPKDFLKELREFAITVGEPCPEGHRRDPSSGACLPIGSTDHTAFTRSLNDDQGPEWRGEVDKTNVTFDSDSAQNREAAVDADEMDEPESCAQGTTFSFIQRRCISLEEAEVENSDEFAMISDTEYDEEEATHQEVVSKDPEGRRDPVGFQCPPNQFFDFKRRECIPLNKDTVMASEDAQFTDEFKQAVATYARLAKTTSDPTDGHKHVATLDEEGNGVTSMAGYGDHAHSHVVKNFVVQDHEGEGYTSRHPGVAVPEEHRVEELDDYGAEAVGGEEQETAAPITTKQRKGLPDSSFGVPGKRKFPLDTCARVRNAMARFNQAKGLTSGEKATLRRKILARAKACGIEVRNFAKAQTEAEFAAVVKEMVDQVRDETQARLEEYATSDSDMKKSQGPCPPGMKWDPKTKSCTKMRGFYEHVVADSMPHEKDPEGRRDTPGFKCPPGTFFDFKNRQCLPLDPSQKKGTTTSKAAEEEAERKLTPQPKGRPARLPQDCPPGTIWDGDLEDCKPLDSRKKTKSSEEEAQTPANGPGKDKDSKGCAPGEFFNPVTKKCMPKKGSFKGKSEEETETAENANPGNREGLVGAPAGKVKHPTDCPPGTMWDGKLKVCKEQDTMEKVSPGNQQLDPKMHSSTETQSLAKVIQTLDEIIKSELAEGRKEKAKVAAKDLPNEAFPPSLVNSSRRSLMHHNPDVSDPYDNASVDVSRLRNALARVSKVEGYAEKAVEDAREHLLYHAREIIEAYNAKKE